MNLLHAEGYITVNALSGRGLGWLVCWTSLFLSSCHTFVLDLEEFHFLIETIRTLAETSMKGTTVR